jgi:hypothetical protein
MVVSNVILITPITMMEAIATIKIITVIVVYSWYYLITMTALTIAIAAVPIPVILSVTDITLSNTVATIIISRQRY